MGHFEPGRAINSQRTLSLIPVHILLSPFDAVSHSVSLDGLSNTGKPVGKLSLSAASLLLVLPFVEFFFCCCVWLSSFKVSRSCVKAEQEERRSAQRISFRFTDWHRASERHSELRLTSLPGTVSLLSPLTAPQGASSHGFETPCLTRCQVVSCLKVWVAIIFIYIFLNLILNAI